MTPTKKHNLSFLSNPNWLFQAIIYALLIGTAAYVLFTGTINFLQRAERKRIQEQSKTITNPAFQKNIQLQQNVLDSAANPKDGKAAFALAASSSFALSLISIARQRRRG